MAFIEVHELNGSTVTLNTERIAFIREFQSGGSEVAVVYFAGEGTSGPTTTLIVGETRQQLHVRIVEAERHPARATEPSFERARQ